MTSPSPPNRSAGAARHLGTLLLVSTLVLPLASCGDSGAPPLTLTFQEIPSPTDGWSALPHLATSDAGVIVGWTETRADARGRETSVLVDRLGESGWGERRTVARGEDLLVNWADFAAVVPAGDGALAAHWLVRGGGTGEDYGMRVSVSHDDGRSWSDPWIPHLDRSPVAHGFATVFPLDEKLGVVWLDGRGQPAAGTESRAGGAPATTGGGSGAGEIGDVSLWFRETPLAEEAGSSGPTRSPGPEVLLDDRTCECCQTDVALTSEGPIVFYRDRSPEEVRDIYVVRRVSGEWSAPRPVHEDGWVFPACPINGPAGHARGSKVAVAWFTAVGGTPSVRVAFSSDAGATFGDPIRMDDGNPSGRVDLVLLTDGTALVSWLERIEGGAEVRVRRVAASGGLSEMVAIAETGGGQASGFPQMVSDGRGGVVFAWTDTRSGESRIRVGRAGIGDVGRVGSSDTGKAS